MEKIIYCCDICGKEILNYDKDKDCILLAVGEILLPKSDLESTQHTENRDLCLHCLATTVVLEHKVAGYAPSKEFIDLIDKRAKEVQK